MKKFISLLVSALLAVTLAVGLTACGGGGEAHDFALNKTEIEIFVGDSFTLTTEEKGELAFVSDNKDVAIVEDTTGRVTGVKAGEATITATLVSGAKVKKSTCKVTVKEDTTKLFRYEWQEKASESSPNTVTSRVVLNFHNNGKIKGEIMHKGYENPFELEYTASGSTIEVTPKDVQLHANEYGKQIQTIMGMLGISMGDDIWIDNLTIKLAANYLTVEGDVCMVDEQHTTKTGEHTVFHGFTMTQEDASKLGITLAEKVNVESVSLENMQDDKANMTLVAGEKRFIEVKITPDTATVKSYTITSSDSEVATLSQKGILEAKKAGTAVITVTSNDNPEKKATLNVTVTAVDAADKYVKGWTAEGHLNYGTAYFKAASKSINIKAGFGLTALDINATYTTSNGVVTFANTETTVTSYGFVIGEDGQPTLGLVTTTYTVTFETKDFGDTTYVSVKVKEKDNQESVESVIVEFGLSTEEIAELAKIQ